MNTKRREAEMVNGSWFKYFHKTGEPIFNDGLCRKYEELLDKMYGNFFDRNLDPEKGPLLSLGVGYGQTEIPLARKGFRIIGIDNDRGVLSLLEENAKNYGFGRVEARFGNLYSDFHKDYIKKGIQACVSFGVLEHFNREDLDKINKKTIKISDKLLFMVPINTPETLRTFKAVNNPIANVDKNGIYRNFWSANFWKNEIFRGYTILDKCFSTHHSRIGRIDMVSYMVKKS